MKSVLRQYATFSGRARRSEYWWFALFHVGLFLAARIIDTSLLDFGEGIFGPSVSVVAVALFIPSLAVTVRRLHDVNHSGWFTLIALIPIVGGTVLTVALTSDTGTDNRHGPSPKSPMTVRGDHVSSSSAEEARS